jgi:predicted Rossmann-fold nucleotide-binding protein
MQMAMKTKKEPEALEKIVEEVSETWLAAEHDFTSWLHRELIVNALKAKRNELNILDLKVINRFLDEFRYAARVFKPYRGIRKVSIFGSARTTEVDPYYTYAVDFARMVITGSGDGIMKAGNTGAGKEHSFGANILLPFEQAPNSVMMEDTKLITFRFFFTRKLFFLMEAHAVALFPGGFGTHDEGFEALTLLQTGKTPLMPLALMELRGEDYWESWDAFVQKQMLRRGLISEEDVSLYRIVHTPQEAVDLITHYYSTYHSMRQVKDRLVIRLQHELPGERLAELSETFRDIIVDGDIEQTGPLPAEADEPHLAQFPRIVFRNSRQRPGRLNQLVLAINELG